MSLSKTTVLVSVSSFSKGDPVPMDTLLRHHIEIVANPYGRTLSQTEVTELVRDAMGIIAGTEPLNEAVLGSAARLKVISRVGVGIDNVDLAAAERLGISVFNTPDAPVDAVAELALGGMLSLLRRLSTMDSAVKGGAWTKLMGSLLSGKTVGVVGLGRIGRRLTELLGPFRVRVLGFDLQQDPVWAARQGVELSGLDQVLSQADIVTLHVPKPKAEAFLIGRREIALMKRGAYLVNTARGGLVDEAALCDALTDGRLGGAYLDTFEKEPYNGPMCALPNVLLTPHIGSYALEARSRMEREAVDNLLRGLGITEA